MIVSTPVPEQSNFSEFLLFSGLKILAVFSVLMFIVAYAVWVERKVSASIQDRRGPNRVGPFGLFQPIADAIKLIFKEELVPSKADKILFFWAPVITLVPSIIIAAVILCILGERVFAFRAALTARTRQTAQAG